MSKKMFDIMPPKMAHKSKALPGAALHKKTRRKETKEVKEPIMPGKSHHVPPKQEKRFPLKELVIGGVVIVLLLAFYGITKLPKADIQIFPKLDTLTLSEKIVADKSVTAVNMASKTIPAQYLEETKESQQEFPATGSASNDGYATGTIKVYNKTDSTFTLVKGTHFVSDSGKYFVTLEKVSIPAGKKNAPGSINVKVRSEEAGEDYNIGPSKFSAPKLYGTAYYYSIYAESSSPMSGGHTGTVKKITDDDIKQAKDALTKKVLQDAKDALKSKIGADDMLLDSAIESNVIETSSDKAAGVVADTFNEKVKVTVSALVFKKQDAEKLVRDNILSQLPKTNSLLDQTLHTDYASEIVDIKGGKLTLNSQSSVKTYYKIDTLELIDVLSMKSSDQIKEAIDQRYNNNISELKINFWPFWVHKSPDNKNRIKINVMFK